MTFEERVAQALFAYTDRAAAPFDPAEIADRAIAAPRRVNPLAILLPVAATLALLLGLGAAVVLTQPDPTPTPEASVVPLEDGTRVDLYLVLERQSQDAREFLVGTPDAGFRSVFAPECLRSVQLLRVSTPAQLYVGEPGEQAPLGENQPPRTMLFDLAAAPYEPISAQSRGSLPPFTYAVRVRILVDNEVVVEPLSAVPEADESPVCPNRTITEPRWGHTATRLDDGRVLIAGGVGGVDSEWLRSAEIYDPNSEEISTTGDMFAPRAGHTATLLPDGRVLVVGGGGLQQVEIYDPATGVFSVAGTTRVARFGHSATLMADGRVLIAGGASDDTLDASAEVYDPTTRTSTLVGSLAEPRDFHAATVLEDGRILIVGGVKFVDDLPGGWSLGGVETVEAYDPATSRFSSVASLPFGALRPSLFPLPDGRVLVMGGGQFTTLLDPNTGDSERITESRVGSWHAAVSLSDGRIIALGGADTTVGSSLVVEDVHVVDPISGAVEARQAMTVPRTGHTATLLDDGTILIVGGTRDYGAGSPISGNPAALVEIYDPES